MQFTSADWQEVQAVHSLQDWSSMSTYPDSNVTCELFQNKPTTLMHRFIPAHLQLSYPFFHPGRQNPVVRQLVSNNWSSLTGREIQPKATSDHSTKSATCISTISRARKQHLANLKIELSHLSPSSKIWWCMLPFHPFPHFKWHHSQLCS